MPFIPHTEQDIEQMLSAIGAHSIEELFDEIPEKLRIDALKMVPEGQSEMQVSRTMRDLAAKDGTPLCFAGAGAYEHHIPAAVWEITTRGEFYSAYTPYQAEASQGTLQVVYEYQTMMAELNGMEVSNASLYDGASALGEAVLMAVRLNRKSKSRTVLIPGNLTPSYRRVLRALLDPQEIRIETVDFNTQTGRLDADALAAWQGKDVTAVVLCQPNFFGLLEDVDHLTDQASALGAMVIAVVNPLSLALLKPPGEWGRDGVDIACGDGQELGIPLSSGGPYYGLLCTRESHVRQMPGRLVGRTVDLDDKPGFALTLQAREQHIRRGKATSNICTNQGLMVTASTIYMAMMGPHGLERVASVSHENTRKLLHRLVELDGVERVFDGPFFHESVVRLPRSAQSVIDALAEQSIVAGYDLGRDFSGFEDCLLVCATETKTNDDIDRFCAALDAILRD